MTAPIAQDKASELIKNLNQMLHDGINEEGLEEVVAEANKLKAIGMYTDASNVLGMVAALRMDLDAVDKSFRAAILHGGRDVMTLRHYATALSNTYQYRRAIEVVDEVVEMVPNDIGALRDAVDLHVYGFDAQGTRKLGAKLQSLGDDEYAMISDEIKEAESVLAAAKTTWEQVADKICVAASAVAKLGKRPAAEYCVNEGVILYSFVLDAPDEAIIMAETAMIDALANEPFSAADRAIYFSCAAA